MNSPILSVHLGSDIKNRWKRYCKTRNVTPSTAIKQVINHLIAGKTERGVAIEQIDEADTSRVRIEIKLTKSELEQVRLVAEQVGYSRNQWVANLVRSYLTKAPQFGMNELAVLNESNSQLLHIGRNLNQMARQLNTSLAATDRLKADAVEQLSKVIHLHVKQVAQLIQANIERWKLK